ncbi:MAG: S-layer homology domain-containing protein [Clostridia bacterium]|nr:S-layer homology domain-containing protein [Clostridia bacterium]
MVVKVNGEEVSLTNGKYTIPSVNADVTVEVSGVVKKPICEIIKPADGKFTFAGEDFAYKGNEYVFTVTPNIGYTASVTVNGEVVAGSGNTYTVQAEGDELTILVSTERISLPESKLPIVIEDNTYKVDVTDNKLSPFSSYHATVTDIKITGAKVTDAFESGTTVYFILHSDTPDSATLTAEFLYTNNNCSLNGSVANITLKDGEAGIEHTVTASFRGTMTKSAKYTLVFFRDVPAEVPPVCIKNSDTKEVWKNRTLEIDLSEYFTDADSYYLISGDEKTVIEGKIYTFTSGVAGVHTLVFGAENEAGAAAECLTITVNVKDIESGVYIGHETGNGALNFVQFLDAEGVLIDGIEVTYDISGRTVSALLPKDYPVSGSVNAKFDLSQNDSGYPFVSTSTETVANKAFNSRFTEKNIGLTGGSTNFTFYYYNKSTGAVDNGGQTKFVISIKMQNDKPVLADGIDSSVSATITAGENYTLDLLPIFTDVDNDELTYKVSINGASATLTDENYTFTTDVAGTYTLVFTANDSKDDSADTYTVTLTVENSAKTDSMTVCVPDGLTPIFYVASGFEDGIDKLGDSLNSIKGESSDGMTAYTVNYPVNAEMISVRTENFGGMAFNAEKDGTVHLRKAQFKVVDYDNNDAVSTNTITYGGNTAVAGSDGWLLLAGGEYIFTATPQSTDLTAASKTLTMEAGADVYTASIMLGIKNPMSITVPTGAKAQLYKYNQYYSNTEIDAKIITENDDGTSTFQFIADTKNGTFIYRVSMDGKITKAGWTQWGKQNITVTYTENDKAPSYRLDNYSATGEANSTITEDSVLLNINSRNHLNLSVGESKTLKAYRAWEIISVSYNNYIIPPDFDFTIIYGEDVVSLTEKTSSSACDGDWMTLTALKEGIAIVEVTYDAIQISGGSYDGVYGASDPARSGLLVVQVGENDDSSVKFGIECFTSIGTSSSKNITYNPNKQKDWDSEFDTLYFLGNSGNLTLKPTASSEITEVSVSHDKGLTWKALSGENGVYTAEIISGNNILRVKTESGTAYQIVRGDKITIKLAEVEGKSNDNDIIEAGETIRVHLNGLHNPIPKMAGNYNPGYSGNYDGYSSQHLNYTCNGNAIYGTGAQYNFITDANFVEVVMPDDGSNITLCDGYIGLGVLGLTTFFDGGDSHRNIPDGGCATRGNETTYHTRSILPEITVSVGDTSAPNSAPIVRTDAVSEGEIYSDQNFAINPDTLFVDPDDDTMTFTVSVNGAEAVEAPLDYKFVPNGTGTYTLLFTATDGKETVQHTITLAVTQRSSQDSSDSEDDDFELSESETKGYVTISFVDKGVRVAGESGLKFPTPLGTIIKSTKVPYKQGEKISHVTKRLLDSLGIRMEYTGTLESGFYLGAICNFELKGTPYKSMGEFDAGVGSGWMITLNKTFIGRGASEFEVENGDVIKWQYTCQLGADIGDPFYSDRNNKTEEKKQEETEEKKEDNEKATFTETTFADVKKDDWHYESVKYVYENNLMQGTGNGFEPESKMSRAMLVTVLYRMANPEENETTHAFSDVPQGQWYSDAIAWASANGIVNGVSKTEFAPDSDISREQMALIIYRFAKMQGYDISDTADVSAFADTKDVSDWAIDAIKWANKKELVNGTSETTFSPKATATRAQVATILMRFCENIAK